MWRRSSFGLCPVQSATEVTDCGLADLLPRHDRTQFSFTSRVVKRLPCTAMLAM